MPVTNFRWSPIWTRDPCKRYRDFFYNYEYISFRQEPDGSFVVYLELYKHLEFKISGSFESIANFNAHNDVLDPCRITIDNGIICIQGNSGTSVSVRQTRKNFRWVGDRRVYELFESFK